MTRSRPRHSGAVLALALFLAAAALGCGGSSNETAASPGPGTTARTGPGTTASAGTFTLTSSAFADNGPIPAKFTCQGSSVSPELSWTGVPSGATELALLVVDPDAPVPNGFVHWVLTGIDPASGPLEEGTTAGTPGTNGAGRPGYTGPCPPSGNHHYIFTLYALATPIEGTADRAAVEAAAGNAL